MSSVRLKKPTQSLFSSKLSILKFYIELLRTDINAQ